MYVGEKQAMHSLDGKMILFIPIRSVCVELQSNHRSSWGTPQVGSLCAAFYSVDNTWYRARVEEMMKCDQVCSVNDIDKILMLCPNSSW